MKRDERIRVVRIIDRLNIGGPALHAVLTTARLDPARYRTLLIYGEIEADEGDMRYLLEQNGVAAIHVPHLSRELRPLRDLRALIALWRLLEEERPHVVHTHKTKAGLLGRLAAVASRVPVRVHTYHGHVLEGYFGQARTRAMLTMERALSHLSTRLVTISARLHTELSQRLRIAPSERFTVVPLGLDLLPFRRADGLRGQLRAELRLTTDIRLIGVVGRLVPIKDHLTFLRALAKVPDPTVHAVLVGGGSSEEQIRAEIHRLGLAARVHLLGWRADLPRIYADLDVLALTSRNEGTPVAVIEALAAGVPVVATAVGGVPDVLRDGRGALVPPGDPHRLAQALVHVLQDPGARARAQALRDEVCEEYGIARLCQDLDDLYATELRLRGHRAHGPGHRPTHQPAYQLDGRTPMHTRDGHKEKRQGSRKGPLSAWPERR